MPRGNRTGPLGEGPNTGRGMGFCTGNDQPGYVNPQTNWGGGYGGRFGGGRGFGRGGGFGLRRGFGGYYQENVTDVSEKTLIENQIRILKDQLSALEDRLSKTEKK